MVGRLLQHHQTSSKMLKHIAAEVRRRCCKVKTLTTQNFSYKIKHTLKQLCLQILKRLNLLRYDRTNNTQKINRVEPLHSVLNDSKASQPPSTPPFPRTGDTGSIYENVCYDSAYDSDDFDEEESRSVINETALYGERFDNVWNQTIESLVVLACINGHHPVWIVHIYLRVIFKLCKWMVLLYLL